MPYSVWRHDIPSGNPFTCPLHAPDTWKTKNADEPPTYVWLAAVKLVEEVCAWPVRISPCPSPGVVGVATLPPGSACAVVVPVNVSLLLFETIYELELRSGKVLPFL